MKCVLLAVLLATYPLLNSNVAGLESENIIGGQLAEENQFPYTVYFKVCRKKTGLSRCGGALIAPNLVLTAAHCVSDRETQKIDVEPFSVVAGTTSVDKVGRGIAVKKIYTHKLFDKYLNFDIAVLRLEKDFDLSDRIPNIDLISLPNENEDFVGKSGVVAGYGVDQRTEKFNFITRQNDVETSSSRILKFTKLDVVDSTRCDHAPSVICGKSRLRSTTCFGDSGSPFVVDNKVIGVVSSGTSDTCDPNEFSTFARVTSSLDFIEGAMNDRPTSDTRVKSFDHYKHYAIPSMDVDLVTTSTDPKYIQALEYLKNNKEKYETVRAEFKRLDEIFKNSSPEEQRNMYKEYTDKFSELNPLQTQINNAIKKYNEGISKESCQK